MPVKTLRVRWEGASNISHTFELFPEFLKALGWSLHRNRYRPQTAKATCGGKEGGRFKRIILNVRIVFILLRSGVVSIEIQNRLDDQKQINAKSLLLPKVGNR